MYFQFKYIRAMQKLLFFTALSLLGFAACKDKTDKTETTVADKTTLMDTGTTTKTETTVVEQPISKDTVRSNPNTTTVNQQTRSGGLSGKWKQTNTQFDVNKNGSIDADEKNLAVDEISAPVDIIFRSDGTCDYTLQMKYKGFYEVKNESGNDMLYLSQDIDGKASTTMQFKYRLVSFNNNELVLELRGGLRAVYKPV